MKKMVFVIVLMICAVASGQQSSPLASGRWWKLTVNTTGMYRVTTAEVPALNGVSVSSIGLYGSDGRQLGLQNSQEPVTGLTPVAIEIIDANDDGIFGTADTILFFGESTDTWRYVPGDQRWEMSRHSYASSNHYFLTSSDTTPLHIGVTDTSSMTAQTNIDTYTAVASINNDLVNMMGTGQVWLGERFLSSQTQRNFTLSLPATPRNGILMRYALASQSIATAQFKVATTGLSNTHVISSTGYYINILDASSSNQSSYTFQITYLPGESSATGYLDFIEISGEVPLSHSGATTMVRTVNSGTTRFCLSGAPRRVWEVGSTGHERAMALSRNGSRTTWVDTADGASVYTVFTPSACAVPAAVNALTNQDLYGSRSADYVVVTHPLFLSHAQRLASLHEVFDTLSTLVVTDQQVYNEFSSGKQDPIAIRSFLRHLRNTYPQRPPRYLVLFGKGTYDNRDLLGNGLPTVATYESYFSFDDDGASYAADDVIGYLDENEGDGTYGTMDVAIGRIPAKSSAEADLLVNKVEAYMTRRDLTDTTMRGDWRNYVALLSDDADPSKPGDTSFVHSSEETALDITSHYPTLNVDRLYADAYVQQSGAIGSFYPDLNNALRQRINYGCLLLNYIGHGSTLYIGTERYIEPTDVEAYTNYNRLLFLVASTCTYGRYDQATGVCGAETFMLARGGAIAVSSASRPISHMHRFNNEVILNALNPDYTIGEALRIAKNNTRVSPALGLLGDPALRLSQPTNQVVVTAVNNKAVADNVADTATVLSRVTISGEIHDPDGQLIEDFDGTVYPVVYDRPMQATTLSNDNAGTEVSFIQQKSVLYRGSHNVSGGRFEYSFTVPRDVAYQYDFGKLSHYARSSADDHAAGSYKNILFGGLNDTVSIASSRPNIRLFLNDTNFHPGGITDENPTLLALLADSTGINSVGSGLGHDITAILDGNPNSIIILNDFFQQDVTDSRRGTVTYGLTDLTPGRHTLVLKAWNIFNLSNSDTLTFTVRGTDTASFSALNCYPNPATDRATFYLETNTPSDITAATMQIYSSRGKMMLSTSPSYSADSYVVGPVTWDVSQVPPGLYLVRFSITTSDGELHHFSSKCIVR